MLCLDPQPQTHVQTPETLSSKEGPTEGSRKVSLDLSLAHLPLIWGLTWATPRGCCSDAGSGPLFTSLCTCQPCRPGQAPGEQARPVWAPWTLPQWGAAGCRCDHIPLPCMWPSATFLRAL